MGRVSPAADAPRLTVRGGLNEGLSATLDGPGSEPLIGADAQCDLRVQSPLISPVHARFLIDEEGDVCIADASSAHGVFLNGQRITEAAVLVDGDGVVLGAPSSPDAVMLVAHIPGAGGSARSGAASEPHQPTAADYTTEPPSMVPEGHQPRAPLLPPPRPEKPKLEGKRLAQLVGGGIVVALLGFFAARALLATSPVIHGVFPPLVEPGQTLTLHGTSFGEAGTPSVLMGEVEVTPAQPAPGQLSFEVPGSFASTAPADVPIRVVAGGRSSSAVFVKTFLAPSVTRLEPDVAIPGDEVVAHGERLEGEGLDVTVAGIGAQILESGPTRLRFRVPEVSWEAGRSRPVDVRLGSGRANTVSLIFGRLPLVTGITPERGLAGQVLTIRGRGLAGDVAVALGGQQAVLLSAVDQEVRVLAPGSTGTRSQTLRLELSVGGAPAMSAATFTLTRRSAPLYRPRFFPQPVEGSAPADQLDVASELGPVLRLSGRAGTPSTPNRASRVAEALNALMEAGDAVPIEVRRTNVGPTVTVTGRTFPIVTVTAQDASAYPAGPSPDELAAFWAALIGDHLGLFLKGERPIRTAALSAHAGVLADLQSEAFRRAAGNGVPMALVSPPAPRVLDGLLRLAMEFPSSQPPTPGIVVAGVWEGQYKEKDQADRPMRIEITLNRGRLQGTLATRSGAIQGKLPLAGVSYEDGRLTFVLDFDGSKRYFSGPLKGLAIEGVISDARSNGRNLGRFHLSFAR